MRRVATADLVADALGIAIGYSLSAYDACSVELGRQVGAPLVTADEALVRQPAGTPYDIARLGNLALPS